MDKDRKPSEEEMKMTLLQKKQKSNKDLLWEIAERNTKRNSNGDTVCTKDCCYREEKNWEKSIKKSE
ncbi:MAG: hypothetical protein CVU87_05130 [Firmicutes bacterium HGW-Firmicutes-12]|jgi:hypothetical protein|nr:MAG: hypothetical protein CVU87_05130 [Firmicutes bacterium HGW-Firmicutes-12]